MKVSGKTIIVTGAGSGMGRDLCFNLLKRGARVAAIDLNTATLEGTKKLAADFQNRISLHTVNITDKSAVEQLPAEIISIHGSVDVLFNNAGIIQPFVRINDLSYEAIERVLHVNFYGMLYMTKTFLPYFLKRPEAHIINTSSMGGFLPVPGQSIYGASKAAVKLFTEGLRSELLSSRVKVTVVFPGAIATNIVQNSGLGDSMKLDNTSSKKSEFKMLSSEKAAEIIVNGVERDAYRILVGSDAKFMDFLYRLNPKFAAEFIYKKMKSLLGS